MREFNLLGEYPNPSKPRYVGTNIRTIDHRIIASKRSKEFFDGDRNYGYGGFKYDGRWKPIAKKICDEYNLNNSSKILQIGSEKGFLLHDIKELYPKMEIQGLETSRYAKENSMSSIKDQTHLVENYKKLLFQDNYFDFLIALGVVYTHTLADAIRLIKEVIRVSKKSFITLASYENEEDYWLFKRWTILGSTILKKDEWKKVLESEKYNGDYYFTNSQKLNLKEK